MSPTFYLHRLTFLTEKAEGGNIRAIFREIYFSLFKGKMVQDTKFSAQPTLLGMSIPKT